MCRLVWVSDKNRFRNCFSVFSKIFRNSEKLLDSKKSCSMYTRQSVVGGTLAIGSGIIFIYFIKHKWAYWRNKGVKGPTPTMLGLGNTLEGNAYS